MSDLWFVPYLFWLGFLMVVGGITSALVGVEKPRAFGVFLAIAVVGFVLETAMEIVP